MAIAAKQLQGLLEEFWGAAEQQMLDRNVKQLKGDWGSVGFENADLLVITDATVLDPAVTIVKTTLDTKKVHSYRELLGELPAGVSTRTITKFVKRVKG